MRSMTHGIDDVLLAPGNSVFLKNRGELLETLDQLDLKVPARDEGRRTDHREHHCILRYLRFLAGEELLPLPVTVTRTRLGQDPPDFVLAWPDKRQETFELTDGSTQHYQKALARASRNKEAISLPVDIDIPDREAVVLWAEILFAAFLKKAEGLERGRFNIDHLIIYDLTGLGLLVPLQEGAPLLRQKIQEWHDREQPTYCFTRISVLRDLALLLDVGGEQRLLQAKSPYYQVSVVRARDENDLRRRLREIDRYCRENSIRHLKLFGSVLGDTGDDLAGDGEPYLFREDSDLDLLVEFEPGTRVTLLDMARMQRELSELIGFEVDLRTAGDLSRYFRKKVLAEAVELDGQRI